MDYASPMVVCDIRVVCECQIIKVLRIMRGTGTPSARIRPLLFDDDIGATDQGRRDGDAKRMRYFQIDHQLHFIDELHRQA